MHLLVTSRVQNEGRLGGLGKKENKPDNSSRGLDIGLRPMITFHDVLCPHITPFLPSSCSVTSLLVVIG